MIRYAFAVLLSGLFQPAPLGAASLDPFTGFVALGDSTSDDGKLGPLVPPPSLGGRFSNGPVWVEYIADSFTSAGAATVNLALAGATAGPVSDSDPSYTASDLAFGTDFFSIGTLDRQVARLASSATEVLGSNPLVAVLFGGNDVLQDFGTPTFSVRQIAEDIANGMRTLAASGNQFNDFLVANLPDYSQNPLNMVSDAERAQQRALTQLLNAEIELQLQILESEGLHIQRFDLFALIDELYARADSLGLRLDATCIDNLFSDNPLFQNCPTVASADQFFFIDGVHFNGVVHAEMGAVALNLINDRLPAPVPLPAGILLLCSAALVLRARSPVFG